MTPARSPARRSPWMVAGWHFPEERRVDPVAIDQAARLFLDARRTGMPIPALPEHCKPVTTDDVNAIVDAVTSELVASGQETIGGWKIGFVYSPRQKPMLCP